jgi:hypothetical protein
MMDDVGLLPILRLDLKRGGFCFHFLTTATDLKINNVLKEIKA